MSQLISFSVRYPSEILPPHILVEQLLDSDFNQLIRPKIGMINVNGSKLNFGNTDPDNRWLIEGEEFLSPGITTLPRFMDSSKAIENFVRKFSSISLCATDYYGEILLGYTDGQNIHQNWLFRNGSDGDLHYIARCWISQFSNTTFLGLVIQSPWFFLKKWWPDDLPKFVTPETAQSNWNHLVRIIQSLTNEIGVEKLKEINLSFEGSGPNQESAWLIEDARNLPKLEVDFS